MTVIYALNTCGATRTVQARCRAVVGTAPTTSVGVEKDTRTPAACILARWAGGSTRHGVLAGVRTARSPGGCSAKPLTVAHLGLEKDVGRDVALRGNALNSDWRIGTNLPVRLGSIASPPTHGVVGVCHTRKPGTGGWSWESKSLSWPP